MTASLCAGVLPLQQSTKRGKVAAWITGGAVLNATIALLATPTRNGTQRFTAGCAKDDSTPTCDLGAMDLAAVHQQPLAPIILFPRVPRAVANLRIRTKSETAVELCADCRAGVLDFDLA
jgi:hypothetical protein